ncbi:hypothetical protein CC1G_14038 [Coprinopsis cinerea okayama7|uniref:Uncharacterized protein n=1 Tax=Coprinopsis cinerea (strain Okayama-7 / 130 / ATCC MYA-4618 / FGSC 9003) TaxID=240176 RepID=D6RKV2_COPC7|nr:hypothetical protein CC1G_14038 [Coprinopsis cinerea okayama7\|eukprot:XP_002912000.1 hypothetical protein CC1G_14038 [Coprinopsis cinerea okayama7\
MGVVVNQRGAPPVRGGWVSRGLGSKGKREREEEGYRDRVKGGRRREKESDEDEGT